LYEIDLTQDTQIEELEKIFKKYAIKAVIHLAGKKSVKESVEQPLLYYDNNLVSTIKLLRVMDKYKCYNLIFSSSATVYGMAETVPIKEDAHISPINAYGQTKAMIEQMLIDISKTKSMWKIISLRYFNPVGLDAYGHLIEECGSEPENLFPYIMKVLKGTLPKLTIFGNDYNTSDGTPVRDYIHITDLAQAHLKAIDYIFNATETKVYEVFNIGTGIGYSVLYILNIFEQLGYKVNYVIGSRRSGDAERVYADVTKAELILHWKAKKTLVDMCRDSLLTTKITHN